MILRHRIARQPAVNAVDWTLVVTQLRKLTLNGVNCPIAHRSVAILLRVCVVAGIIIVRVIVISVVREVIPREEIGIQATPETIDKDKEAIVIEVGMPPIPVAMPIGVVTFGNMGGYSDVRPRGSDAATAP